MTLVEIVLLAIISFLFGLLVLGFALVFVIDLVGDPVIAFVLALVPVLAHALVLALALVLDLALVLALVRGISLIACSLRNDRRVLLDYSKECSQSR